MEVNEGERKRQKEYGRQYMSYSQARSNTRIKRDNMTDLLFFKDCDAIIVLILNETRDRSFFYLSVPSEEISR